MYTYIYIYIYALKSIHTFWGHFDEVNHFYINTLYCVCFRDDDILQRMVRSANDVQGHHDRKEQIRREETKRYMEEKYPWMTQNKTLGNYFLNGGGIQTNMADYRTGAIVFLHQHRSAGSAFTNCLSNISRTHNFVQSASFTSNKRYHFDNSLTFSQDHFERIKIITGQFSFGLCNTYKRPCSSFTIFRDPLQSAMSSYEFCKSALEDEQCRVLNANTVSLRDWILHHGSTTFNALSFNSDWCKLEAGKTDNVPCWKQHKNQMDGLHFQERDNVLQYMIDNMENWFSMIGLFEKLSETVAMLENAYMLPFSQCNIKTDKTNMNLHEHTNAVPNTVVEQISNSIKPRMKHRNTPGNSKKSVKSRMLTNNMADNRANHVQHMDMSIENEVTDLQYDYDVRKALEADYQLYTKATQIFNRQREIVYNKL